MPPHGIPLMLGNRSGRHRHAILIPRPMLPAVFQFCFLRDEESFGVRSILTVCVIAIANISMYEMIHLLAIIAIARNFINTVIILTFTPSSVKILA